MILYFDTETTGLYPGKIIQLAYIMDYGTHTVGKNFYFDVNYIEPSAERVHNISVEDAHRLSGGKIFEDYADEIHRDFMNADLLVAHNFKFDLSFMLAEFDYIGEQFRYKQSFDTMRYFTPILKLKRATVDAYKFPKLIELAEFYDVYSYDVSRFVKDIFGEFKLDNHEARYDTSMMYLSVRQAIKVNDELKNYLSEYNKNS